MCAVFDGGNESWRKIVSVERNGKVSVGLMVGVLLLFDGVRNL